MSNVFVVKNQHGHFASKQKEWVDGRNPKVLFNSAHRDEAINLVFELSSKDIYLRAEAISVELTDNKLPVVEVTAPIIPLSIDDAESSAEQEPLFDADAVGVDITSTDNTSTDIDSTNIDSTDINSV